MRLQATFGAALLLLAGAAPLHAQRDTIRIGRGDTVRVVRGDSTRADAAAQRADSVFDTPGTHQLVLRVIRTGTNVPEELADYRADMHAAIYLSLQSDTAQGGELPVTVDEVAGEVRWDRSGGILQTIRGHRVRLLAPAPYTVGSMVEAPWVVPHLYGNTINVFSLAATPAQSSRLARAIHPFSYRGIDFYRYTTGDTVRVRTQEGATTLIPIRVRPRPEALSEARDYRLVAGTFWVDLDRAAVARARFGFVERGGRFVATETGTFLELESALIGGRYWLPVRQRREIQVSSPLVGGSAAIRVVTTLSRFDLNTGWRADSAGTRLVWRLEEGQFADWPGVGTELAPPDIADFADLREQVRPPRSLEGTQTALRYENSGHLFRYNRVEGAFVGLGLRLEPRNPDRRDWHVYAHGGWAFAEGTARGELAWQWHPARESSPTVPRWSATVGAYRRLRDMTSFRPPLQWEIGYALGAALGGYDVRDYYDATGLEAYAIRRRGSWTARFGARAERHDSVSRNTTRSLFGGAGDFPEVFSAREGTHAAAEGLLRYARGTGAFGLGNSTIAQVAADAGLGDFRIGRVTALLTTRRTSKLLTLALRGDAGAVLGDAPPQFIFRFGGTEGLRGYERNEFGGTMAALGRGRLLLHLPPYTHEPLFRAGVLLFPPLRPALVVSGDAGWTQVSEGSRASLDRLLARETDGVRWSYGAGLSLFEDAVSAEYVWPGDGGEGRWYVGFVAWF